MKGIYISLARGVIACLFLAMPGIVLSQQQSQGRDRPANIVDMNGIMCVGELQSTTFRVRNTWTQPTAFNNAFNGKYYHGFSTPLVADLNGDGKPEIIVLGVNNPQNRDVLIDGTADRIDIIDAEGQLLKSIPFVNFTFNTAYRSHHGTPCNMAIGKANEKDPYPCIVLTTSGNASDMGKIYCFQFTDDQFNYTTAWSKAGDQRFHYDYCVAQHPKVSDYKPNSFDENFRFPMPHIADFDGDGNAELLVYNKIYSMVDGSLMATTEPLSKANVGKKWWLGVANGEESHLGMMSIADLDGDGLVEIAAGNKIYKPDFATGSCSIVATLDFKSAMASASGEYYGDGFTALGDIDGDGRVEIIVLGATLESANRTSGIRTYAWRPDFSTASGVLVGATTLHYSRYEGEFGMPFVGDINFKPVDFGGTFRFLPEICFILGSFGNHNLARGDTYFNNRIHPQSASIPTGTTNGLRQSRGNRQGGFAGHVVGLTFDPQEVDPEFKLKISWALQHSDFSECTGLTTFDFTNSGHPYVVYRDEAHLRVIDASNGDYVLLKDDDQNRSSVIKMKIECSSYTGYEIPVVADINGDESADFITISSKSRSGGNDGWSLAGRLFLFEGLGAAFVGAPKVWNQFVYSPLLVNEDLSIPKHPIEMLTPFQKCTPGATSNCSPITPYNGTLLQQPIVRSDYYAPAILTPDAVVSNLSVVASQSSPVITVKFDLTNNGSAAIPIYTPITFYQGDDIASAVKAGNVASRTQLLEAATHSPVYPGETEHLTFSLTPETGEELRGRYIWVRVTDDGTHFPAHGYYECDTTTNAMRASSIVAVDDVPTAFAWGETRVIDILGNDLSLCSSSGISIDIRSRSVTLAGTEGDIFINSDNKLVYRAGRKLSASNSTTETITYRIACNGMVSSDATITITVVGTTPGARELTWTGAVDSDWSQSGNWSPTITSPPDYCTNVIIPEHSLLTGVKCYPELKPSDLAICDTIVFGVGAEIAKPVFLTYNAAKVSLRVTSNRWHSIAPPLRNLYSGDFIPDGVQSLYNRVEATPTNPSVYQKRFQWNNTQRGIAKSSGNWSGTYSGLNHEYTLGSTMAVWADKGEPETADGTPLTFTFPKDSLQYAIYESNMNLSTYGQAKDVEIIPSRRNAYRFIYEERPDLLDPSTYTFRYPVENGDDNNMEYVIVGNPFMSHIDVVELLNVPENRNKIEAAFRIHGRVRQDPPVYETFQILGNGTISTTESGDFSQFTIPPMQSFIAMKKPGAQFTHIAMPPSVSVVANGKHGLRSADGEVGYYFRAHVLKPSVDAKGSHVDERISGLLVRYKENASNSFVFNEDVRTINTSTGEAPILYTVVDGDFGKTEASINTIGDINETVELGVNTSYRGLLKLKFTSLEQFPIAKTMWLEDKLVRDENGRPHIHDLLTNPVYEFSTEAGDNAYGRFFVHFNRVPTSIKRPDLAEYIRISVRENILTVVSSVSDPIRMITVCDFQGRIVLRESNLDTDYVNLTLPQDIGMCIVRVTTQGTEKRELKIKN